MTLDGGGRRRIVAEDLTNGDRLGEVVERRGRAVRVDVRHVGGVSWASSSASSMQRTAPRPLGSGAVMWCASAVEAAPITSARMVAPRSSACSHSSRIKIPAPSPMTNPSRSISKGRERSMLDSAVMLRKPARAISTITASAPPATATVERPDATRRAALPIACVPAAHAVVTVSQGPPRPKRIETAAVAAFGIIIGTRKGDTRSGPREVEHGILFERGLQSADTRRDDAARVVEVSGEPARAPRFVGCHQRIEREGVETAQLLGVAEVGGVKGRNALGGGCFGFRERAPEGVDAFSGTRQGAETGDGDSAAVDRPRGSNGDAHYSLA